MSESEMDALLREAEEVRRKREVDEAERARRATETRSRIRRASEEAIERAGSALALAAALETRLDAIMASKDWKRLFEIGATVLTEDTDGARRISLPVPEVGRGESTEYLWRIGSDLRLVKHVRYKCYAVGRWEIARLNRLSELPALRLTTSATKPTIGTVTGGLMLEAEDYAAEERSALARCGVELIGLIERGELIEAVASLLRKQLGVRGTV